MPSIGLVTALKSSVICVQEHSAPIANVGVAKASLRKLGYSCIISPPDPEAQRPSGGTAILVKRPLSCQECAPQTKRFEQAVALGRASLAMIAIGTHTPLLVVSVYGWGSSESSDQSNRFERTSDLLEAVSAEVRHWPACPAVIAGDFNAGPSKLPPLGQALWSGAWFDLGTLAGLWGQEPCQATAIAHNACNPSRLDFVLANVAAFPLVKSWAVHGFGEFDVHSYYKAIQSAVVAYATARSP